MQQQYLFAYGSLLSDDSRKRYSDIHETPLPATVNGWQRAWITRSTPEQQTYVGATACLSASINGVILPIDEIDPDLQVRERDYEFVQVPLCAINWLDETRKLTEAHLARIWICQSKDKVFANHHHPVYQSYLDTCLVGCLEAGDLDFARAFIAGTQGLAHCWVNDRHAPRYPRAAQVASRLHGQIDGLLNEFGLLTHRKDLR